MTDAKRATSEESELDRCLLLNRCHQPLALLLVVVLPIEKSAFGKLKVPMPKTSLKIFVEFC